MAGIALALNNCPNSFTTPPITRSRTMKAARIHEFGGPEVLKYEDISDPALRKDHVLVRVRACALNHLDLWVRKGLPGVQLPHILGSDIAGEECAATARLAGPCVPIDRDGSVH